MPFQPPFFDIKNKLYLPDNEALQLWYALDNIATTADWSIIPLILKQYLTDVVVFDYFIQKISGDLSEPFINKAKEVFFKRQLAELQAIKLTNVL